MGVNVAAHIRHMFLGSAPTPGPSPSDEIREIKNEEKDPQ